jgi:hypothetical protein
VGKPGLGNETFRREGRPRLADERALSGRNGELFTTPVLDRIIQLVLTGIARLQRR